MKNCLSKWPRRPAAGPEPGRLCHIAILLLCFLCASARAQIYPSPYEPTNMQTEWATNAGIPGGPIQYIGGVNAYNLYVTNWVAGTPCGPPAYNGGPWSTNGATDNLANLIAMTTSLAGSNLGPVIINWPPWGVRSSGSIQFPWHNGDFCPPVAVRGFGPGVSALVGPGTGNVLSFNGGSIFGGPYIYPITNTLPLPKDGTNVLVASTSGLSLQEIVTITQTNDPLFCTNWGSGGFDNYTGWFSHGTNLCGQMVRITSLQGGTNIGFTPPLLYAYNGAPILSVNALFMTNSGVENMTITRANPQAGDGGAIVSFNDAANFWITNCEISWVTYRGLSLQGCYQGTAFGDWIHDAVTTQGSTAYGVDFYISDAWCRIENCAIWNQQFDVAFEGSAAGCVIDYNYLVNSSIADDSMLAYFTAAFDSHGGHGWFDLLEGNILDGVHFDYIHASSSHVTILNNAVTMNSWVPPENSQSIDQDVLNYYAKTVWPGGYITNQGGFVAFNIDTYNLSNAIMGNVVSTNLLLAAAQSGYPVLYSNAPATSLEEDTAAMFEYGYDSPGRSGVQDTTLPAALNVGPSTFDQANWNPIDPGQRFVSGYPTANWPASYLYTNAPAWWPPGLAWPPVNPFAGTAGWIPAENIFQRAQPQQLTISAAPNAKLNIVAAANTAHAVQSGPAVPANGPPSF